MKISDTAAGNHRETAGNRREKVKFTRINIIKTKTYVGKKIFLAVHHVMGLLTFVPQGGCHWGMAPAPEAKGG
jgi:hypothetical protein